MMAGPLSPIRTEKRDQPTEQSLPILAHMALSSL